MFTPATNPQDYHHSFSHKLMQFKAFQFSIIHLHFILCEFCLRDHAFLSLLLHFRLKACRFFFLNLGFLKPSFLFFRHMRVPSIDSNLPSNLYFPHVLYTYFSAPFEVICYHCKPNHISSFQVFSSNHCFLIINLQLLNLVF